MKKEVIELIQKEKIIAIVRGVDAEHILPTAEALYKGGIHLMLLIKGIQRVLQRMLN